jgi:hypothetical protein
MTLVYRDVKGEPVLAGETSMRVPADARVQFVRLHRWFHRGWVDRQNGVLFPDDFDLWPRGTQLAYEQGRLAVSNVMSCGPVPVWYGDRFHAEAVEIAMAEAKRRTGSAIPPAWSVTQ